MKVAVAASTSAGIVTYRGLYDSLTAELGAAPDLLILHCSASPHLDIPVRELFRYSGTARIFGGTSCNGVVTDMGLHVTDGGVGMLGISDPNGSFGVGASVIGENPKRAAETAVLSALENANRPGEVPAFVLISSSPGHEEQLLAGIASVVGGDVPIAGGSSADDAVAAEWRQFANGEVYTDAVVVAVLFPSTEMMFAFHSGYEPTNISGIVTKAQERRLCEIDGKPAGLLYNEWIGGGITDEITSGGCIMAQTTLHPLGRIVGYIGTIPYYKLSHPNQANTDGTMNLFTDIAVGDELVLMSGTANSLVTRAGRVALSAMEAYSATPDDVCGALIMYCAGCMLGIKDRLDEVVDGLRVALPKIPFLVTFSFGEQGCFLGGENQHGNLMISVLLFTKASSTI